MPPSDAILKSALSVPESLMELTHLWAASRSKDPSTKVGACIYHLPSGGMFVGYNGFPKKVIDHKSTWTNRNTDKKVLSKYDVVMHAEKNALYKAMSCGINISDCVLVCTHIPCPKCMLEVVCANGIKHVYYRTGEFNSFTERDRFVVETLAAECGVRMEKI